MSVLIGKNFGRYQIRSKIGEGGMGEVYTAHDKELNRDVAIKVLSAEFSDDKLRKNRFRQEARTVSALNHPNIITIYEIGENKYGNFIVTELIEGKTLRQVIKYESLTLIRTLKIIEQIANALVAAHATHIVHRDIKPENIMVRHDSIVKVLDFGLAKPTPQNTSINSEDETVKTIPGIVMGSARYMSPEQARGISVDERTDIWSLGVVLYELLTGNVPFDGISTGDTIAAVIYKEPIPILNIFQHAPAELQRIVRKSLQKDRDNRYQSVKDFALDIRDLLYELEHQHSGERIHTTSKSFELSENPTMIHQTTSANHHTKIHAVPTANIEYVPVNHTNKRKYNFLPIAAVLLLLITILGFGLYNLINNKPNLAATAFEKPQVSRINTDGKVLLPAISPDGKYVAYVSGESGNRSLVVRQVSTDSLVTVVQPTNLTFSAIVFSPEGDYIYYCLTRSDFSVNTLYQVPTLGGAPKKLIEDVDSPVTFSPDGKKFAFMRHTSNTNEDLIFTVDTNSLENQQLFSSKQTEFNFFAPHLAWSPDGEKILVGAGNRQAGFITEMIIAEISIAEKILKKIKSPNFFSVNNFTWFKDGSGFLFTGRETQNSPVQIWRASYPNVEIHPVTNDFNDYTELSVSTDGKTIITLKGDSVSSLWRYTTASKENTQIISESRNLEGAAGLTQTIDSNLVYTRSDGKEIDLWTLGTDGKNPRSLLNETNIIFAPTATRDGRYIVYNSQKSKASRICRADADGKNAIQLTEENPNYIDFNPQVTADGKTVIFQRQNNDGDRTSLMKISIDGGQATPFYQNEQWNVFQPRISPDGKRIAFSAYDINTFEKRLKVASLNGDSIGQIEKDLEFNLINQYYWSPDSKSLTISTNRDGVPNLMKLPLDDSAPLPITDFKSGKIFNFAWSNDGKNIFIVRGITNNDLILIRDSNISKG